MVCGSFSKTVVLGLGLGSVEAGRWKKRVSYPSMVLFQRCMAEGIIFGPGSLFTATDRFGHCLRLSFAGAWADRERVALARIGELARELRESA